MIMLLVLKAICISLFSIGALFILLELRARLDRSFLYFGATIILLAIFTGIDLWRPFNMRWIILQHIVFVVMVPCMVWYLMILTRWKNILIIKGFVFIAILFSILFICNFMFVEKNGTVTIRPLYALTVIPYIFGYIVFINYLIVRKLKDVNNTERKILTLHLVGFVFFGICGIGDLFTLLGGKQVLNLYSSTIFGVIGLSVILCYSFTERLILIVTEKRASLAKLEMAHKELDQARSLSEIGKFSAFINHEIRNYATAILSYAELVKLGAGLSNRFNTMLEKIIISINHLTNFSDEVLDLSKAKTLKEKNPLNICKLIRQCANDHFPDRINSFTFINMNMDKETIVYGEGEKLEHVFVNLFKNSFEAQANSVIVKTSRTPFVSLISIEDDGIGCDTENLKNIFKAFHTTKKIGSGLGTSIVQSIIGAHGANINVASKNLLPGNKHGLVFSITFPVYHEAEKEVWTENKSTVLIKKDIDCMEKVLRILGNVYITPNIIHDISDLRPERFCPSKVTVVGNPDAIGQINKRYPAYHCFSIASTKGGGLYVKGNHDDLHNCLFCEEFVISHLAKAA